MASSSWSSSTQRLGELFYVLTQALACYTPQAPPRKGKQLIFRTVRGNHQV